MKSNSSNNLMSYESESNPINVQNRSKAHWHQPTKKWTFNTNSKCHSVKRPFGKHLARSIFIKMDFWQPMNWVYFWTFSKSRQTTSKSRKWSAWQMRIWWEEFLSKSSIKWPRASSFLPLELRFLPLLLFLQVSPKFLPYCHSVIFSELYLIMLKVEFNFDYILQFEGNSKLYFILPEYRPIFTGTVCLK